MHFLWFLPGSHGRGALVVLRHSRQSTRHWFLWPHSCYMGCCLQKVTHYFIIIVHDPPLKVYKYINAAFFCFHPSCVHTLIGHVGEISNVQFNWDCSLIISGSMDKTCKVRPPSVLQPGNPFFDYMSMFLLFFFFTYHFIYFL